MAEPISGPNPYYPEIGKSVPPEIVRHLQNLYTAINNHDPAICLVSSQLNSLASKLNYSVSGTEVTAKASTSSSPSSSTAPVTAAQAQTIASAQIQSQFPTQLSINLGGSNPQIGTSYTIQNSDYSKIVSLDNAGAVAVTLNSNVTRNWWGVIENLGAGTVTLTPTTGNVNDGASITLVTNQGAFVGFDGTNWWALTSVPGSGGTITAVIAGTGLTGGGSSGSVTLSLVTPVSIADGGTGTSTPSLVAGTNITITGSWPNQTINSTASGGVTSLQTETGAITLTSSGSTVAITTPTSSTINLEATGSGLPVHNPTFTGTLTGPIATIDQNVVTSATPPTVGLHSPAGSGATATIGGNDTMGEIFLTAGTGASAGYFADINLHTAYGTGAISCIIQCVDTTSAGPAHDVQGYQGFTTGQIQLDCVVGFTAGHVYSIRYLIFGY